MDAISNKRHYSQSTSYVPQPQRGAALLAGSRTEGRSCTPEETDLALFSWPGSGWFSELSPSCLGENKVTETPRWSLILTANVSFQSIITHLAGKALWSLLSIKLNIFWDFKSDAIIVAFPCHIYYRMCFCIRLEKIILKNTAQNKRQL